MLLANENYSKLKASYLFSDIAKRIKVFQAENPDKPIIRLGIGDVTEPLPPVCVEALHKAVDEMACRDTFRGYGPEQGYSFLREAIAKNDFAARGADIEADEIFVSDGAKCDTGNIQELFGPKVRVAVPDPVYPVYVDTNVMAGRTGKNSNGRYSGLHYLDCTSENSFVPAPPKEVFDVIYLCYPNNPTGAVATAEQLAAWVKYARKNKSIILFDAAYEAFIRTPGIPHSIFEIEGARDCCVEFRSFSKTAGFTGTRCGYAVVPKSVKVYDRKGNPISLHVMWMRRQTTKFNGCSYIVQRAAEAIYSKQGKAQVKKLIDFYLRNAKIIRNAFAKAGYKCTGGENSPYVWVDINGKKSWDFFDKLLHEAQVVTTPGAGFGKDGEGFIRVSSFNSRENVEKACKRISAVL